MTRCTSGAGRTSSARTGSGRRLPVRGAAVAAVLGITLLASACGSGDSSAAKASGKAAPKAAGTSISGVDGKACCAPALASGDVNGISTRHNGWDIAFVNWLVPHDAVASQIAELVPKRSDDAALKAMAAKIDAATAPRYVQLSQMATAWGIPVPSTDPAAATGHDHGGGGVSEAVYADILSPLKGAAFDRRFLQLAIAQHQAALVIAKATVSGGDNSQDVTIARKLISVQSVELATMRQLATKK